MKTKLQQVLEKYLNHREVAVWGHPSRLLQRELQAYPYHAAGKIDIGRHYIVLVTEDDLNDFLQDEQSRGFTYPRDYFVFSDIGCELPFEWDCYGARIGRQTYFGEAVASACQEGYVESIGHFTSINGTAKIHVDHQMTMSFVSDEVTFFFSEENKNIFRERYQADPKHPYASGKNRLTIGSDVWMGSLSFINCSKVTSIGHGAVIGAGAVVLEDVPPYAVAVGVPAKIKRYRYAPDMIETLLRVRWWEWSAEEINANADALMSPEIFMARFGKKGVCFKGGIPHQ